MPQMGAPAGDPSNIPRPIGDTIDSVRMRDMRKNPDAEKKTPSADEDCLLPPLSRLHSPVISATALAVPSKAQYEYAEACAALDKGKTDKAEKHLRKAVEVYAKYPAAWVTLGQLLAVENHTAEARSACFQASTVEPNYVPAYLCLAEIAAWGKSWNDVLQFSERAIQLDPITTPIGYEYNADANLRLSKLDEAENSARRAAEIDKDNKDPRVHFLLVQIYEAKHDRANEIAELKQYVSLVKDAHNAAEIKQYLAELERPGDVEAAGQNPPKGSDPTLDNTAYKNSEEGAAAESPAANQEGNDAHTNEAEANEEGRAGCNLNEVLPQVENVQKFTATQLTLHEALNAAGKVVRSDRRTDDYTVSIGESAPSMLEVREYQNSRSAGTAAPEIVTKGLPALLLIFHPIYAGDFSMRCEKLASVDGQDAWQVHFRQRSDKPSRIRSYSVGTGRTYPVDLEGRAWFTASTFQIIRLEADLARKIPEIQLTLDHTTAEYGPVHFQSRGIDIWLPQAAELTSERGGKRFHEQITFSNYLLFAIDNKQQISAPKTKPAPPLRFARLLGSSPNPWF
jgi:tetratricopeptide (TPR) repeat protein